MSMGWNNKKNPLPETPETNLSPMRLGPGRFAIGSAALVSLALFGAFVVRIRESSKVYDNVIILGP